MSKQTAPSTGPLLGAPCDRAPDSPFATDLAKILRFYLVGAVVLIGLHLLAIMGSIGAPSTLTQDLSISPDTAISAQSALMVVMVTLHGVAWAWRPENVEDFERRRDFLEQGAYGVSLISVLLALAAATDGAPGRVSVLPTVVCFALSFISSALTLDLSRRLKVVPGSRTLTQQLKAYRLHRADVAFHRWEHALRSRTSLVRGILLICLLAAADCLVSILLYRTSSREHPPTIVMTWLVLLFAQILWLGYILWFTRCLLVFGAKRDLLSTLFFAVMTPLLHLLVLLTALSSATSWSSMLRQVTLCAALVLPGTVTTGLAFVRKDNGLLGRSVAKDLKKSRDRIAAPDGDDSRPKSRATTWFDNVSGWSDHEPCAVNETTVGPRRLTTQQLSARCLWGWMSKTRRTA